MKVLCFKKICRRHPLLLTTISIVFFGFCHSAVLAQAGNSSETVAKRMCEDFYSEATFLVRFQERDQQLDALQRIGNQKRIEDFLQERAEFRSEVLRALEEFPGTLGFFLTDNLRAVQSGDYATVRKPNGELLEVDRTRPVFIIDPYVIKSTTFNQNLDGFSILLADGAAVPKPFPNFVLGRFLFFKRDYSNMVAEWLEKIDLFCKKLNAVPATE